MQYLDDLITRQAYKCVSISPSEGVEGAMMADSTLITADSTIITADSI